MVKKRKPDKKPAVPRASSSRQRLRLIDACISALHIYGPSRTTVEKVVAIAGMSPGIVRFYFSSKAAMLVASLQFLATEFEQRVLFPVAQLRDEPVRALTALVDLYLDPEIASPRKVSVWYSFWGEASSREEYLDICGQKDARFAELVRELIERLIAESDDREKDADAVALGLIGVLEMLWQDIAFQTESRADGGAARRRAFAYLRSVFPGHFADVPGAMRKQAPVESDAWQVAVHECAIAAPGSFVTADLPSGAVVLFRDQEGHVRAMRNVCPVRPHALVVASHGRFHGVAECPIHGPSNVAPAELDLAIDDGLVLVRAPRSSSAPGLLPLSWESMLEGTALDLAPLHALSVAQPPVVRTVGVPWARLVQHWLEFDFSATPIGRLAGLVTHARRTVDETTGRVHWRARLGPGSSNWSAGRYAVLAAGSAAVESRPAQWYRLFVPPNQWIERRPEGLSVVQAVPAAGGCSLRWLEYRVMDADRRALAMSYLVRRLRAAWIAQDIEAVQALRRADH
jgi:AcrR family transcriptional regulator/phenylpropionate dioxygenase-like ring-hydroxylating dioxygenase large terminal subunit